MMFHMTDGALLAKRYLFTVRSDPNPIDLRDFRIEVTHLSYVVHLHEFIGSTFTTCEISQRSCR